MATLRYALRSLLKAPGFTLVVLVTLALGIGVNTSMFSLVDVLLLRSAPFPQGDRIFQVMGDTRQGPRNSYSEVELRELRAVSSCFASLTALNYGDSSLAEAGLPPEQVTAVMASAEFFATFGVQPMLGRAFTAEETKPGNNQVIVLSHAFWQKRSGGSPAVIGRTRRIDAEPVTVIGVMPASFDGVFLWGPAAFWRPLNFAPEQIKQRSRAKFIHKDVGWDTGRLLTGSLNLPEKRFPNEAARIAFYRKVEDRLAALPGVENVALTTGVPIWGDGYNHQILTEKQASADTANVLSLVLGHGLQLAAIGLGLDLGGACGLARLLNAIMPRLVSPDALAPGGMAIILFAAALIARWIPARRATRVDPLVALRAE